MEDQPAHLDQLTSSVPPSRLRTRIMASSYRYQQLNEETYLDLDDDHAEPTSCFKSVSSLKRMLVVLLIVCIGLFIALIAVAAHDHGENYDDEIKDFEVCDSPECIETSAYILSKMNMSVDPCEDMYQFSCGGWLAKTTPPSDRPKWDSFLDVGTANMKVLRRHMESDVTTFKGKNSSALTKLKMYYRTCMDKETIEARGTSQLIEVINSLGSWTVVSNANIDAWNDETWTLQSALIGMHHLMRSSLFGFDVMPDPKNTKRNIITFSQSGLTLAHEGEYKGEHADKFKEAFLSFAVKVSSLLGGIEKDVRAKMTEVYNFEKKLAEIYVSKENMTNPLDLYNKMKLSDFQDLLGRWIDIRTYLRLSFYGHTFTKDEEVLVITPSYFKKLGPIIEETDKEVLANYLMWNLMQSFTGYLPDSFSTAALQLTEVESGVKTLMPRWKRCLYKTEAALGFASSLLFVNDKFAPEMKTKVVGALDKVRKEFIDNLGEVTWLDDETRSTLRDKTKSLTNMVGYPDWLLDVEKLDERYDKLHVEEGEFLSNKIYAVDYKNRRILDKYGKAPDRTEWEMYPDVVNAYYSPIYNYVVVPAGILQPPFFTPDFPDAFLYGTIGMIVGHELTHGFDNQGRNFDKYGNLDNIWTVAAEEAFKDKSKCMVDQYGAFKLEGQHVSGKLTLGENIADNGGLKFGFRAYKSSTPSDSKTYHLPGLKLTNDQLYFLGFSQIWCAKLHEEYAVRSLFTDAHSPNMYRVIGTLQNSYEFAKAFNCDANSFMNPKKKCRVW